MPLGDTYSIHGIMSTHNDALIMVSLCFFLVFITTVHQSLGMSETELEDVLESHIHVLHYPFSIINMVYENLLL